MCEVMKMCPQGGASIRVAEVGGVERDCNLEDRVVRLRAQQEGNI